ncbi:protein-tyrosine-phosphatase [Cryptococcus neoformans C23]|uniref:Protein-tyrosine-phosphatase n=2 Tax=Cryptococcus neoformans TaxID=5207 RepID=A0A854QDG8_CRYNE|nr:protein-tyrosine-phosphatase [Cryptococcus neoformans var. grubii AD2-60a]OWZ44193.1 protein-tyrosine-phosphatase [Cryptococcus neoformans var. grubii C23]OWZ57790.1 protein-tyrosine-phosphatase [Cryptococcus neoformans var. grubii 125.91]OXC85027.1 protein-tyrosine-phosphatase [Cryptococcus neoformans var. grubii AD1-7a]OXG22539.1 protein-tyrosine-phosphatase [Cryptococcus neoformans var. grubii Tu259-1]OXG33727.1 protein-tyrosine-phosphatase [Cryptococcus neoformans var. grubii Bt15]OXG4
MRITRHTYIILQRCPYTAQTTMANKPPSQPLIQVPALFSIVEPGVYRSASPTPSQVPFLAGLNLKTIISLTPEHPIKPLLQFVRTAGISFVHLGLTHWRRPGTDWRPVRYEIIKTALEAYILDTRAHPVLLIDPLGVHQTGCLVGALRMMQGWNFASALMEYRAHAGSKHRYLDEQYIELFDSDLINLPAPQYRPSWWLSCEEADPQEVKALASSSGGTGLLADTNGRTQAIV